MINIGMDTPHISGVPLKDRENYNYKPNDRNTHTISVKEKLNTAEYAIAPSPMYPGLEKEVLVQPNKLFNFTNEYDKDLCKLFGDKCLSPNYGRYYNYKDKKYRGNQFGVRYNRNRIFNRPLYYQSYKNNELTNPESHSIIKPSPYFDYTSPERVRAAEITNNDMIVNDVWYLSHPYFNTRADTVAASSKWTQMPVTEIPYPIEKFGTGINYDLVYLVIGILLIIAVYSFIFCPKSIKK